MTTDEFLKVKPNIELLGEKFHRGVTSQNFSTYKNYDTYPISYTNNFDELTFRHRHFYDATIHAQLLDAPSTSLEVEFKDPWLEDAYPIGGEYASQGMVAPLKGHLSPWNISSNSEYHGVFLNQDYNIPGNPYYSVGAPNPNYINGIESYFLSWDNTNPSQVEFQYPNSQQSGVVFKVPGATATAKYKVHLASSSTQATGPSTQRKFVRDDAGVYYMVYESADKLWYTKSVDGTTWSAEKNVTAGFEGVTFRAPSITFQHSPALVCIVAEGASEGIRTVYSFTIDPNTDAIAYDPRPEFTEVADEPGYPLTPMIATAFIQNQAYELLMWRNPESSSLVAAVRTGSTGEWSGERTLRYNAGEFAIGSNWATGSGNAKSTTSGLDEPYGHWQLVWVESGNLLYAGVTFDEIVELGDIEYVTEGEQTDYVPQSPSVITNPFGLPSVAWMVFNYDLYTWSIYYSEKISYGKWGIATLVYTEEGALTPSLTIDSQSGNITLFWQAYFGNISHFTRVDDQWYYGGTVGNGAYPSASYSAFGDGTADVLWTNTSGGAPHQIEKASVSLTSQCEENGMSGGPVAYEGRGGKISFENGGVRFAFVHSTLDDMHLQYAPLRDSVRVRTQGDFEQALETKSFTGQGRLDLKLLYKPYGTIPQGVKLQLSLRDTQTGQTVYSIRSLQGRDDSIMSIRVPLLYGSRRLKLSVQPAGLPSHARFAVERWLYVPSDSARTSLRQQSAEPSSQNVPTQYFLHEAYPNPFNPSATIAFDLPDPSQVSLIVYDVLGRKVVELENSAKEAGYHSTTWNANGVASGVYFARFIATVTKGNIKLSSVSKLLLTK